MAATESSTNDKSTKRPARRRSAAKKSAASLTVVFELERDTKNKHRYAEVDTEHIHTLYIEKDSVADAFDEVPEFLTMTLTPGEDA